MAENKYEHSINFAELCEELMESYPDDQVLQTMAAQGEAIIAGLEDDPNHIPATLMGMTAEMYSVVLMDFARRVAHRQ